MRGIEEWLAGLGLGEYAARFGENGVDLTTLPDLTEQDLKELGVLLGHRRKLLRAIAELGSAPAAASPSQPVTPPLTPAAIGPPPISASVEASAERRHLAVMFCDLVGSTGIAARLDAEDWRDLVGAYLDAASNAVTEMGGHVAKKLGDGLMALFGYPVALENDAERAVRAALAIQRALTDLNRKHAGSGKPELAARIGIESGQVVVDASGEIFGDAPNVAARVQALAEPSSVLVTARVQSQVAGLFVAEDRGFHELKGVPEPVTLFRLVRASGGGRRVGARQLTPLVGREEEMAMLARRWERARQGDGQLVLVMGEPGLGKSRLIDEFHAQLRETPHTWVEWGCSQLLQNTPLHPISEWGRQRFGNNDVPAEQRLSELESSLAQVRLDPAEHVPLLAPLLDIPMPKERSLAGMSPEELRRRQLAAVTNWVIAGARVQPVVLAMEDLHWADPTTLDVLRGFAERGALAPLLILATTRPEFRAPWGMRSHHSTISLAPLDRHQVRHMVGKLAARLALPQAMMESVAERTGGVPLFVEEVTRLLLERGEQGGMQSIPPTLQQSLAARLDRLGPAREVAQIGAVFGRDFSYVLLRAVAGLDEAPLQAALERLADADILHVQGLPPNADYRFKHALIQDAAYENLLKSRRQSLHRRVAKTLRDSFPARAEAEPETVAHHFTQAGLDEPAIEWWGRAGDQALRRSAFQEAISHLGKAIEMTEKLTEGTSASPQAGARLRLQTAYGNALISARGYQAPETSAAFARARELAAGIEDAAERFSVYYGVWAGSFVRGDLASTREVVRALLHDCESQPESPEAGTAYRLNGETCWFEGNFEEARIHLERALAIHDPDRDRDLAFRFAQDAVVTGTAFLASVLWSLGEVDRACRLADQTVARATQSGHIPTIVWARTMHAFFAVMLRNSAQAAPDVTALLDLARSHGMTLWIAYGGFLEPWVRSHSSDRNTPLAEMRRGIATLREQGVALYMPMFETALAELEAEASQLEAALATVDRAIAETEQTGQRWFEAEIHRIRGEILLRLDPANLKPAEDAFQAAIAIAQAQKARSFELRAALALAKLYQGTDRAADAYAVLAPAVDGFEPTPEFPEVEEAQTLLAALAQTDEVKSAVALRQRRLDLQIAYGQALLHGRGYHSPEAKAAFDRTRELAAGIADVEERFSTYYGLWVGSYMRGEAASMREFADAAVRDSEASRNPSLAGLAHRINGTTCWMEGADFAAARFHLEKAVASHDAERDRDLTFRYGQDLGVSARMYLALVVWAGGEPDRARGLVDEAMAQAVASGHVPTLAYAHCHVALLELMRLDAVRAKPHAAAVVALARERGLGLWALIGPVLHGWAVAGSEDNEAGLEQMRSAMAAARGQGIRVALAWVYPQLAAVEAEAGQIDVALRSVETAIAEHPGLHFWDSEAYRVRGRVLLRRDPGNTASAEESFQTAIAVAQQQKARSFELRAALDLAKLYQGACRDADARAVLAPALDGFSATPEFPEIEEAQALIASLKPTEH